MTAAYNNFSARHNAAVNLFRWAFMSFCAGVVAIQIGRGVMQVMGYGE